MLLVAALAALTIAVLAAVILPIIRRVPTAPERAQYDRAVYRDQLLEIERDIARGMIAEPEAQAARLEIQRRIIASDAGPPPPPARISKNPILAVMLCLLVAAGSTALYLRLGSPGVPDEPFAAHHLVPGTNFGQRDVEKAAATLAEKLKTDPNNKGGWLLYARTTATIGDWQNSVAAYRRAIELGADDPETTSSYGEVLVMLADGMVTPVAHEVFAAAAAKDTKNPVARFYLALADAQAGEPKKAIDAWLALAGEAPEGSAMRNELVRRITETAKAAGLPTPRLPHPPPAEQTEPIPAMVAQLAAKLEANPNDLDGWLRLGRSYSVLGEAEKSAAAYDHAAKLKPDDLSIPLQEAEALLQNRPADQPLPPRAIELLHRVETTEPNQPEVLWYLGAAAVESNHIDEAERYWQRLLSLLPADGPDQKMVREALNALKPK